MKRMKQILVSVFSPAIKRLERYMLIYQARKLNQYQPLPWIGYVASKRTQASKARWDMIKPELPEAPFSALDVGANAGYFSLRLAESGGFVVGIEQHRSLVQLATRVRDYAGIKGCSFSEFSLMPKTIEAIGTYDVVLMLSVFHNMTHYYGYEAATKMLKTLLVNTRRLMIFETGECGSSGYAASMPNMGDDRDLWIQNLLRKCGAEEIRPLGEVPVVDDSPVLRRVYAISK